MIGVTQFPESFSSHEHPRHPFDTSQFVPVHIERVDGYGWRQEIRLTLWKRNHENIVSVISELKYEKHRTPMIFT